MLRERLNGVRELWCDASRVSAADLDGGWRLVTRRLGGLLDAQGYGFMVVIVHGEGHWRATRYLDDSPLVARREEVLATWRITPKEPEADPYVARLALGAGSSRAQCFRDLEPEGCGDWCSASRARRAGDRLSVVMPTARGVEVCFGFDRGGEAAPFYEDDREIALATVSGLVRTCRWLSLVYGPCPDGRALGDRERTALGLLLTGSSEKEAASRVGTTPGAFHQTVVQIYRKLGVRSRAELMALWHGAGFEQDLSREPGGNTWQGVFRWRRTANLE